MEPREAPNKPDCQKRIDHHRQGCRLINNGIAKSIAVSVHVGDQVDQTPCKDPHVEQRSRVDKCQEKPVIPAPDTGPYPWAMMVKLVHARVTHGAVGAPGWAIVVTCGAPLDRDRVAIDLVVACQWAIGCGLQVGGAWDVAWVSKRSEGQEEEGQRNQHAGQRSDRPIDVLAQLGRHQGEKHCRRCCDEDCGSYQRAPVWACVWGVVHCVHCVHYAV